MDKTKRTETDRKNNEAIEFSDVRIDIPRKTVVAKFKVYTTGGENNEFIYEEGGGKRILKRRIPGEGYDIRGDIKDGDIESLLPLKSSGDSILSVYTGHGITTVELFNTAIAQFAMGSTVGSRCGYESGVNAVCEQMNSTF